MINHECSLSFLLSFIQLGLSFSSGVHDFICFTSIFCQQHKDASIPILDSVMEFNCWLSLV